jgi:hypothetical protein
MLRLLALCVPVVVVMFVLIAVCDFHSGDITASHLAMEVRSLVVAVRH